jgi:hypothetical protein
MNAHASKDLDAHRLFSFWHEVTASYGDIEDEDDKKGSGPKCQPVDCVEEHE